jgi:predicted ArsR family transcriptional regulator
MIPPSFLDNPRLAMAFRVKRLQPQGSLELPYFNAIVTRNGGRGETYRVYDMTGEQIAKVGNGHTSAAQLVIDFLLPRYRDEPAQRQFTPPSQVKDLRGASQQEITGHVAMLFKSGMSYEEIAVILGITRKSVINRLSGLRASGRSDLYRSKEL